jgi:hypothetical protein
VFDSDSNAAVGGVVAFLPAGQVGLPGAAAVRDQQSGALVAAVGQYGRAGHNPVDLRGGVGLAVVAVARPRLVGWSPVRLPFRSDSGGTTKAAWK